jgi:hypothetical protein
VLREAQKPGRPRTSEILRRLAEAGTGERLSLREMMEALGDRGFGLLIFILALPNAIPGPAIPFMSALFALPLIVIAGQLALGWAEPMLPDFFLRRSVDRQAFCRFVERTRRPLERVERWIRPRAGRLTSATGERFLGVCIGLLGVVLSSPLPLCNLPPAIAIMIIALGLLEEDAKACLVGLVAGAFATLWVGLIVLAGAELVTLAAGYLAGL